MKTKKKPRGPSLLEEHTAQWETLRELAGELEITTHHLRYLRRGQRTPSLDLAAKIERVCGIPMSAWSEVSDG